MLPVTLSRLARARMRPELEAQLLNCRNLPSPPGVALRIIELAQDPDVVMATAADTIGLDAALSARMLRIANSPLYASRRRVENLSQALTVLGLNATLTLASAGFETFSQDFTAPAGTTRFEINFFAITGADPGSSSSVVVDNVQIIPEPSTWALLLGGMGLLARRRASLA